jgi:membrane associated rhomboid family serine protease
MFPIRDNVRARSFPLVNIGLIAVNVLVFLFETSLAPHELDQLIGSLGATPALISLDQPLNLVSLLTSIFLHGSWFHLISNMWALFIFGDNVEDRMGPLRYLAFYLFAGIVAGLVHTFVTTEYFGMNALEAQLPTVGASGAIAGVLGAYLILYPRGRVITLIPVFILPWFVEIPAFLYLGFWFVTQLFPGLLSLGALGDFGGSMGGVAWWAHIGGFVFGMLMVVSLPVCGRNDSHPANRSIVIQCLRTFPITDNLVVEADLPNRWDHPKLSRIPPS